MTTDAPAGQRNRTGTAVVPVFDDLQVGLTLNILLSFAQFEREIIGERTRDKIAATRRKGKWTGGHPVLGVDIDPHGSKLVVNELEAIRVKQIFELYLKHGSLIATVRDLEARGWMRHFYPA